MTTNRILVTGASGFIGSHLTRRLVSNGAEVTAVVKYSSVIDNVRLSSVWDSIHVVEADLRNRDSLSQVATEWDAVFHLAAYNHVGDSFTAVSESLECSLIATANLLETLPGYGRFVYTSTSEVYGLQDSVPFREDSLPAPISPYSVGKYAGELYSKMKRHQTGNPIVCVRPFNTFGPYQSEKAVIPELINRCLRGLPVRTTAGEQTREFNYVDNIVDGLLAAAERTPPLEDVVNLGSGEEIAIRDLVSKIHELCESTSALEIGALPYRPTEIWRMAADNEKAGSLLGWTPKVSFEQGLERTVAWFKDYTRLFHDPNSPLNTL